MEPESSLPYLQVPVTCPYPKPARSSNTFHRERVKIYLSKYCSNKIYHIMILENSSKKPNYIPTYFGSGHHHTA